MIELVGFDGDDTLWHSEGYYQSAHGEFERIVGEYRPTAKNGMVREHFPKLGFAPLDADPQGITRWTLGLAGFAPKTTTITIVRS